MVFYTMEAPYPGINFVVYDGMTALRADNHRFINSRLLPKGKLQRYNGMDSSAGNMEHRSHDPRDSYETEQEDLYRMVSVAHALPMERFTSHSIVLYDIIKTHRTRV
jgi:hypothetical protein